ncbi:hypothetical protein D3C84_768770 [compost metagenome]
MPAIAAFQRFAGQPQRQGEQLALQLRHGLAFADLPQRPSLCLRRAGRILLRQLGKLLRKLRQALLQYFGLNQRQAARLGIVRGTLKQDVPHRQQRRAMKAPAIAFEVTQASGLVTRRHLHFALQQQACGRLLFVLTCPDL